MPKVTTTGDAELALRQILKERVDAARGTNTLVSKVEAQQLDPFLQQADLALRQEGGPGTRVTADALVEKAAQQALRVWQQFQTSPRDARTLANDEVAQVKALDPALGALTELAVLRVRGRGTPDVHVALRSFFGAVDFSPRPVLLPGFTPVSTAAGTPLPAAVRDAFGFFSRVTARGGESSVQQGSVGGVPVFALVTSSGSDTFVEVRGADGVLIDGLRSAGATLLAFDSFPGRVRLCRPFTSGLSDVRYEEGLSEEIERADAGQVPHDWPGEATLESGLVRHHQMSHFVDVDLPAGIEPALRDVAIAAFEYLWEGLMPRLGRPDEVFELGRLREGTMKVGSFTRSTDGRDVLAAYWRDIDDNSHVLYFERTPHGPRLVTDQFDN